MSTVQDLRLMLQVLWRAPRFALVVIAGLVLGSIGARSALVMIQNPVALFSLIAPRLDPLTVLRSD